MPRTRRRRKITKIIQVPANFATISHVDEKYVTYELNYTFNLKKAILSDAVRVRITIDPRYQIRRPVQKSQFASLQRETNFSTGALRRSILNSSATQKRAIKNSMPKSSPHTITLVSDLSSVISNTIAGKITSDPRNADAYLPAQWTMVGVPRKHAYAKMESHPALGIVAAKPPVFPASLGALSMASILKDGIDPAVIGNVAPPMITPQSAIQGFGLKSSIVAFGAGISHSSHGAHLSLPAMTQKSQTSVPGRMATALVNQFNQAPSTSYNSLASVKGAMQPVMRRVINKIKKKQEKIKILRTKIGGTQRVMFIFELLNSRGKQLDRMTRFVNHQELINEILTPDHPPTIEAKAIKTGFNGLAVRQHDKMATHAKIIRQFINPSTSKIQPWAHLITVAIKKGEGEKQVIDKVNNSRACVYRATAVGEGGRTSETFDSAVTKPVRVASIPLDQTNLSFVSIFAYDSNNESAVSVRVMNVPNDVCAIYVTATDESARCPTRPSLGHCRIIDTSSNQIRRVHKNSTGFVFTDVNVKSGHTYRYECVMLFPSGKKVISPIPAIHTHRRPFQSGNLFLKVSIAEFTMEKVDTTWSTAGVSDPTVTFTVTAGFTDEGLNSVVDALSSAGIASDFVNEIQKNKQEFEKLLRCEIERHDIQSGEVETFGVQDLGVFTDNITSRAIAGVSEMLLGRQYRYIVRLLQRDPMGLLEGSEFTAMDPATRKEYKLRVGKFLNPLALEQGTLPSYLRSLGRIKTSGLVQQNPFLQGHTGFERDTVVFVPKAGATEISSTRVDRNSKDLNVLVWKASGEPDYYSHFLILGGIGYGKYIIGTVGIQASGQYIFTDHKFSNRPGTVEYFVLPVYSSYTYGKQVKIGEVNTEHPTYDLNYWADPNAASNVPPPGIA